MRKTRYMLKMCGRWCDEEYKLDTHDTDIVHTTTHRGRTHPTLTSYHVLKVV